MSRADRVVAFEIEKCGDLVYALGERGLANELWALAARLRRRSRTRLIRATGGADAAASTENP